MLISTRLRGLGCLLILGVAPAHADDTVPTLRECKAITDNMGAPDGKLARAVDELHQANASPTAPVCDYLRAAYVTAGDIVTTMIQCESGLASNPEEIATVAEARRLDKRIGQLRDQIREVAIAKGCASR